MRTAIARALIAAALVVSVALGACFLLIQALRPSVDDALNHPDHPLSDDQARAQVVEQARQIDAVGHLQRASGGYTFISCKNESDPPYQGAVYLTFDLPSDAVAYFEDLAAALVARGWREGSPPSRDMPGKTLSKDGVTAIFNRNGDSLRIGTVRLYGECRDVNDHRRDTTAWVDITDQLH
jgi:hypothetical protein